MTVLSFSKALSYFRGNQTVELEDVRHVIPFVLHDKLQPDPNAPFFEAAGNAIYRVDRIGWIRRLFDLSCAEFDRLDFDRKDDVGAMADLFAQGLDGLTEKETKKRLADIEQLLGTWSKGRKLYGNIYDDVLKLKYLHQRYTNYLNWLMKK